MTKVIKASKQSARLKREILGEAEKMLRKTLEPELRALITPHYEETVFDWRGATGRRDSVEQQWAKPSFPQQLEVDVEVKIDKTTGEVKVVMSSMVLRQDGAPHNLWYWLDRGTDDIPSWPYGRSRPFRNVNSQRTYTGTLRPNAHSGYAGNVVVIQPGQPRAGIEAAHWSEKIGVMMERDVAGARLGGIDGWHVSKYEVIEPQLEKV